MKISNTITPNSEDQLITLKPQNPVKENLENYGYKTAGANHGSQDAFVHGLNLIRNGDIMDASRDHQKDLDQKEELAQSIEAIRAKNTGLKSEISKIEDILIPSIQDKIVLAKNKIEDLRLQITEHNVLSDYSRGKHYMFLTLTVFLGIYLFVFYTSALHAAFFNDVLAVIEGQDDANIALILNSIFNPEAFLNPGKAGIFTYLGTFFIFALGMLPHYLMKRISHANWRIVAVAAAFLIPLMLDGMLAYKIDHSLYQVQVLIGLEPDPNFWTHINFYMVIAFGYLAYLTWALFLEAAFEESDKKNNTAVGQAKIENEHQRIADYTGEITNHRVEINKLNRTIEENEHEIVRLEKRKGSYTYSIADLKISLDSFVQGFFKYLNNLSGSELQQAECRNAYHEFKEYHFPTTKINLN